MIWVKRRRQGPPTAGREPVDGERLAELDPAVTAAAGGGREELDRLTQLLTDVELTGDARLAERALELLAARPRVTVGLDEHARRAPWHHTSHPPASDALSARLYQGILGPLGRALASTHRNGRVREAAVAQLLAAPSVGLMPFLVLRTNDWVKPVRDRARAGLALLLADDPGRYVPAVLGMTLLMASRLRGGFAVTQATAALIGAPPAVRDRLAAVAEGAQRRLVIGVGLAQRWWRLPQLVDLVEHDPSPVVQAQVAEVACQQALWQGQIRLLQRLAGHRHPQVRALALTALARLGQHQQVAAYLADPAGLVRAIARQAATRTGTDPVTHYRQALAGGPRPPVGAVAGLAETGSSLDESLLEPLLEPLLRDPRARLRAQVVRALRLLTAPDVKQLTRLLDDPAPRVIREVTTALLTMPRAVPPELPRRLLASGRPELRLAGYRLLRANRDAAALRAALILATDPDPRLARRGQADTTRYARDLAYRAWRHDRLSITVTEAQRAELDRLTRQARTSLGENTSALLTTWLATPTPTTPPPSDPERATLNHP